jgi:hypothetical protein
MGGWRLRQRTTAGLGLFALLLQLVLSFGHIHTRDLLAPGAVTVAAVSKSTGQAHVPSGLPDDDCPICAVMHMAASGLLPAPPFVAGPAELAQVLKPAFIEEFNFSPTRHVLFQTRAPPLA